VPQLPFQDNYHDCGLYTLTYLEFFSFHTPRYIHNVATSKRRNRSSILLSFGCDPTKQYPTFLTRRWFPQPNGSRLRFRLMVDLLGLMVKRARLLGWGDELHEQIEAAEVQMAVYSEDAKGYVAQASLRKDHLLVTKSHDM
jgi:hypothetical protein